MSHALRAHWLSKLLVVVALGAAVAAGAPPATASRPPLEPAGGKSRFVPGEFLVKFKPGTAAGERRAVAGGQRGRLFAYIAGIDVDAVEIPALRGNGDPAAAAAVIAVLKRNPNVEFAEPNYIVTASFTPNDPELGRQWAWNTVGAFAAWETTRGSAATTIAIVDTGVQPDHPELQGKLTPGYDFVDNDASPIDGFGHGTHVAGTAAAATNNATGGAGMCPNCSLLPVRVLDNSGYGTDLAVAQGIDYAVAHGAKVINLSLAGTDSTTMRLAVDNAWNAGAFLACAAGNDGTDSIFNAFPGAYSNCFAVAATDTNDQIAWFSNHGPWVQAAAPGLDIFSTWINSGYNTISGTSMATPHVAGLAGLLASQGLTNTQIRQRICQTADPIPGTGTLWACGRINADRAINYNLLRGSITISPGFTTSSGGPGSGRTLRLIVAGTGAPATTVRLQVGNQSADYPFIPDAQGRMSLTFVVPPQPAGGCAPVTVSGVLLGPGGSSPPFSATTTVDYGVDAVATARNPNLGPGVGGWGSLPQTPSPQSVAPPNGGDAGYTSINGYLLQISPGAPECSGLAQYTRTFLTTPRGALPPTTTAPIAGSLTTIDLLAPPGSPAYDGPYTFYLTIMDNAGNTRRYPSTSAYQIILDSSPPSAALGANNTAPTREEVDGLALLDLNGLVVRDPPNPDGQYWGVWVVVKRTSAGAPAGNEWLANGVVVQGMAPGALRWNAASGMIGAFTPGARYTIYVRFLDNADNPSNAIMSRPFVIDRLMGPRVFVPIVGR